MKMTRKLLFAAAAAVCACVFGAEPLKLPFNIDPQIPRKIEIGKTPVLTLTPGNFEVVQCSWYPTSELAAKEIADAAQNGDAAALQVWREFGECLAELLSGWIARWNLERVALGGQIAKAWELFRAPLDSLPVHPARLPEAALYGAFSRARDLLGSRN